MNLPGKERRHAYNCYPNRAASCALSTGQQHIEITVSPRRDQMCDVSGVAGFAEKMIGASERNEAFGMLRSGEDAARIIDTDDVVVWRVKNE